jgi:hypothetical protein
MTLPSPRRRPPGCPSDLRLDELRAGDLAGQDEEAGLRAHLVQCATCRDRNAARAADPVLMPDAAISRLPSLAVPARARPRGRWGSLGVAGAIAGAAAAFLIVWGVAGRGTRDTTDGRTKGALTLTVHVKRAGGSPEAPVLVVDEVNGEGRLRAGDEIRFTLLATRPGYAVVLGLDTAPSVTVYAPALTDATAGRPARVASAGMVTLPGSVVADDSAGFERMFAVVCDTETPPETLRRRAVTALALASGRPERVTSLRTGCLETSVLFRKEPR